jgi:tartrate dehydrogenase/decarboxylase/D-malate dehydrogenase
VCPGERHAAPAGHGDAYDARVARHRIALLPGDGVGVEVTDEARKVVDALGLDVEWTLLDWGSDHWHRTGSMMPPDWEDVLRAHDACLMGACGRPDVPDHVSLWGLILLIRQTLDLWANVRPARLLPGVPCPLADREPRDVDMLFVRENTEGEYAGVGGRSHRGHAQEVGIETSVFTRFGVERVVRHAFELAEQRRGLLTSATKSNASRYGYVLWDEVCETVAAEHPGVRYERVLVDALAARMVRSPDSLDVVVASNLFADILTDLAAAIQGGMGMAASANVAPGAGVPGLFEPVHGSAPDIAGQGVANPCGAVWSTALMLAHLGEDRAAARVMGALEDVCRVGPRTRDIGGEAGTTAVGDAIVARIAAG